MRKTIKENLKYMNSHKKNMAAMFGVMFVCCVASVSIGALGLGVILK